ncbi:hypothetical protein C4561_04470 [candidate division WWE3 bacterium]|jgi:hypothetical protein|uniref:Uncharacterized protein n=1 Tax=candidate division WWE3 bacterium TaxID=2053526 RepID=A0A3A4ZCX1_UNCKA|nr:MAG: hypothetical protein C4561_04470 [candidate division WWE3 bacterium]
MEVKILRPSFGRFQLIEWFKKQSGQSVLAFVYTADKDRIAEACVLLDFYSGNEVSIVIAEFLHVIQHDPTRHRYHVWKGPVEELYNFVLSDKEETYGHLSVRNFVRKNKPRSFFLLKDALVELDFRFSDEIMTSWKVSKRPSRKLRYNPNDDPNQLRLNLTFTGAN